MGLPIDTVVAACFQHVSSAIDMEGIGNYAILL
jgi:hypothetical protein